MKPRGGAEQPPVRESSGEPVVPAVYLDDIVFALQPLGGISTYWARMGEALQAMGHLRIQRGGGSRLSLLARVATNAPVFHSSFFRVPAARRTRCVVTVHDTAFEERVVKTPTALFSRALRRRAVSRADVIVCVSEHTRQRMLACYPAAARNAEIRVIHHGCGNVPDELVASAEQRSAPRDPAFALFVGGRNGYKNFHLALRGFALSRYGRDAEFVCAGAPLSSGELKLIHEAKLTGKVRSVPNPSVSRLHELYEQADMLLYPSSFEGFGLPILEAMALYCPVVASGTTAIPEIAGGAAVLLPELRSDAIAVAIDQAAEPARCLDLIRRGRLNALRYSWRSAAASYEELYHQLQTHA
ncbi:glycosyltransferase family 1 protein [soil metagenome]